jgi:hypothetical protein
MLCVLGAVVGSVILKSDAKTENHPLAAVGTRALLCNTHAGLFSILQQMYIWGACQIYSRDVLGVISIQGAGYE